jgi:hypothetical protein
MPKRGQNILIKKGPSPTPIPVFVRQQKKFNTIMTCSSSITIPITLFDTHTEKKKENETPVSKISSWHEAENTKNK